MANNTTGTTIKVDTHDLELTINSLKNAITGAIKGINTSANDKQSGFESALQKLVVHSLEVSSRGLREFHQSSLTTMSGEVLKYEKIINGTLTKIEQSKLITQTENHGRDFEERDKKVRESQNQLISEQKQAFTDFRSALKQVANRLLTVSGMFDTANELQDRKNHADYIGSPFKDLSAFITVGKTVKGADETYLRDAYDKMFELFQQRHTKGFDKNELLQALAKQPGQEHLIENLKKISDKDPIVFIEMLMKAMSQGKDNSNISKHIKKDITNDDATYNVLTGKNVLKYLPWAKENAGIVDKAMPNNLVVGQENRKRQADHEATKAASVDQSAPILNTINQLLSRAMEQFPDTSKTIYSLAALGSALDDTAKTAVQLGGGLLLFKGSLKGLGLVSEAVTGSGLAAGASRLTPYAIPVIASYMAATAAVNTTADHVNGNFGSIAVPRSLTDAEQAEWEKKREERIKKDYKDHGQDIATVDQNMNGQKLSFDKNLNQYVYTDQKTNKVTKMGMILPEVGHASDEMRSNTTKIQEYQQKTGTKIIMLPKAGGMFSSSSIEFVAIDADGNKVANFGRKLKMPEQDMADRTQKGSYKRYPQQGSLSTVSQVYPPPHLSEAVKSSIKDQSFNQSLSMDMSKIKEQMSTSMQLSRQLLNTPSTMQQRFNFYFTLPQNNSGRIEHSFDNNVPISRRGNGSVVSLDRKFPQTATPFKA